MTDIILSTKHAILSSGGTKYNDLYYNQYNSSSSLLECTFQYNQIYSLSSLNMGSTSSVNVLNDSFVSEVLLHLRLPPITTNNQTLIRGWGYKNISGLSYTLGSSNTMQIQLQGDSILQTVMSQIADPVKRDEVLRLAGQEVLKPYVPVAGEDPPHNDAYILLPLPFSTFCDKLPVDSTMLQNNINIQIQFDNDPRSIYGGSDTPPNYFQIAELIVRTGRLSDQSKSVRAAMIMEPNLKYSYPMIHSQHYITPSFIGQKESSGNSCDIELTTFPNADLVGIMMWVVKDSDRKPTGNSTPNPWNLDEISNVRLDFASQPYFNFPGKSYMLTNMLSGGNQGPSYIPTSYVSPGAVANFQSSPRNSYPVFFDFARLRATCFHEHFFNTWRLTNQNLRIRFNTTTGESYKAYCTYFLNAVVEFQNGTSSIYID